MLGTKGGGFFNATGAHPFENPTALSNLVQMVSLFAIDAALTNVFGRMVREVWGNAADPQYLRVYVRALRQKLESRPEQPRYILTETGVGYRLRAPDHA